MIRLTHVVALRKAYEAKLRFSNVAIKSETHVLSITQADMDNNPHLIALHVARMMLKLGYGTITRC